MDFLRLSVSDIHKIDCSKKIYLIVYPVGFLKGNCVNANKSIFRLIA